MKESVKKNDGLTNYSKLNHTHFRRCRITEVRSSIGERQVLDNQLSSVALHGVLVNLVVQQSPLVIDFLKISR